MSLNSSILTSSDSLDLNRNDCKPHIAGVVLCLNEADNIRRSVASLSWCNELFVVDSGSSDNSQKIAEECGAKVLEHRQHGQFLITEQRNWALMNAGITSEWVIFLDADEEIQQSCQLAIQNAISSPNAPDGFLMTPRFWFLGRWLQHTQGYPNWHPRLLKKGRIWFEGGVWESFSKEDGLGKIQEPYEHYAFSKGINDWIERHLRYAGWDARDLYQYKTSGKPDQLSTKRALQKRVLMANLWPLRPIIRFLEKYILNGGFLEGWQGLTFSTMMGLYEFLVVIKFIELRRKSQGKSL